MTPRRASAPVAVLAAAALLTAGCGSNAQTRGDSDSAGTPAPTLTTTAPSLTPAPRSHPATWAPHTTPADPSTTATTSTSAVPSTSTHTYEAIPTTPPHQATVPAAKPAQPKGAPSKRHVKKADAGAVAHAVVTTMYRQDTTVDTSPTDAARRATRWMTPSYAKAVAAPRASGGGAQWLAWQKHRAYTTVTAKEGTEFGAPPDTATRAIRQYAVTITPHGRDGWKAASTELGVTLVLTRHGNHQAWRVDLIRAG